MQRQSLGSPGRGPVAVSKDDVVSTPEDYKRRDSSPSLLTCDDEIKPEKPLKCHYQPEKFIHLIPLLVIFCFFILYLSSHDPSANDLGHFNGFKHPEKLIELSEIDDVGRGAANELKRNNNGVFAIRSLRNLQEDIQADSHQKSRNHRKLGDF